MRTRKVRRTRTVTHTINGKPHDIEEDYEVLTPAPPRDLDRLVGRGVTLLAVAMLIASIAWSTASIGSLLSRAATAAVAYGAATVFDALWIGALAFEWLARYQPAKQTLPRWVGHLALLAAMTAVAVNGWLTASPWVGVIGAMVSAAAKVMWAMSLRHTEVRFDARTQAWVEQELGEAGARMAMVPVRRRVLRAEQSVDAEHAALDAAAPAQRDAAPHDAAAAPPDAPHETQAAPQPPRSAAQVLAEQLRAMEPADAIRIAHQAHPQHTAEELTQLLAGYGITADALLVTLTLRGAAPAAPPAATAAQQPGLSQVIPMRVRDAELIRAALDELGDGASSKQIAAHIRARHGRSVDPSYVRGVRSRDRKNPPPPGGQLHASGGRP